MKAQFRHLLIFLALLLLIANVTAVAADTKAKPVKPGVGKVIKPLKPPKTVKAPPINKADHIKGDKLHKQAGKVDAAERAVHAKEFEAYEAQEADRVEKQHDYVEYIEAAQGIYEKPSDESTEGQDDDLEDQFAQLDDRFPELPAYIAAFNAFGYIHLLLITSSSHKYLVELMQLLAFACFPTLPLIQFLNNLFKTVHAVYHGKGNGFLYIVACLSGTYALPRSSTGFMPWATRRRVNDHAENEVEADISEPGGKFVLSLFLVILQIGMSVVGILLYTTTPTRSDWDVAPVAQDQRQGWTALSGLLTSTLSFFAFMCNATWRVQAPFEKDKNRDLPLIWEVEIFTEIVLAALLQDVAIAWVGGTNSLIGLLTFFMANRIVLIVVFLAVVVFNRYLRRLAGLTGGPKKRFGPMRPLFIAFTVFICGFIVVLQIMSAVGERFDLGEIQDYVPERRP